MLIYQQLIDCANRIKKVIDDNPDKKIVINMGLLGVVDMDKLRGWVKTIEREMGE